jgi:geranylgeranyl diphosphate synthase type I
VVNLNLQNYIKKFKPIVDEKIKEIIPSGFPNLYDAMNYAFATGGKRLRPIMCLAVCDVLGGEVEKALPFAISIEFIHSFSLIHDDIQDEDKIRRGFPTVWKKYGIPHAINVGDGMIFKAYECLFKTKLPPEKVLKLAEILTNALIRVVEGQNMEMNFRERNDVTAEEYMQMIWRKSGILFGTALWAGAFIADAPEKTQMALLNFGKKIGSAFQIRDDVLNLIGEQEKYGKEIGGDIKEGKRTLIVIHCLSHCKENEKEKLLKILKTPREKVVDKDVEFVIELVKKYNSIKFAQTYSENLIEDARIELKKINNEKLRKILNEFADFMIRRKY